MSIALLALTLSAFAIGTTLTTAAFAQTVVKETTATNSAGTISEFSPDTIVIRSRGLRLA